VKKIFKLYRQSIKNLLQHNFIRFDFSNFITERVTQCVTSDLNIS